MTDTYFWIDPAEKLIRLQMIQATPGSKARQALQSSGINHLAYGALAIPEPSSFAPPAVPATLSPKAFAEYVGTYGIGNSVSSRGRQGLAEADGKTGWLGIEELVAMEQEGLRINRPDPGGPPTKAGVTAGDLITDLDDVPLKSLSLAEVLAKLRGPANTTIAMKVVHKGQGSASDVSVVRAARRVNAVRLQVRVEQGNLVAEGTGLGRSSNSREASSTPLVATSSNEFTVDDEDHTRIALVRDAANKVSGIILNPGPWEQRAALVAPGQR